jgi:S-phase kinase-associated protein 1
MSESQSKMITEDIGAHTIITLTTEDNKSLKVPKKHIEMSVTVKNMLEDLEYTGEIEVPLPNVTGAILEKIIAYCKYHTENPSPGPTTEEKGKNFDIGSWDKEFCNVDQATLFSLILAANYMDIKPLLDVTCKTVAEMIKGKTPEEIRKTFNIKNDFTPEEEEAIKKENEWCEEK